MTRRILFALLLLTISLPVAAAAAGPEAPEADAPAAPDPAPQDGFQGCPFVDLFWFAAPAQACDNLGAGCDPLCAAAGGTLVAGVTKTGADCTCVCCRI